MINLLRHDYTAARKISDPTSLDVRRCCRCGRTIGNDSCFKMIHTGELWCVPCGVYVRYKDPGGVVIYSVCETD